MALTEDGRVLSWGMNNCGQLGHGNTEDIKSPKLIHFPGKVISISCGDTHSSILTDKGLLFTFGNGKEGQIGRGELVESSMSSRTKPVLVDYFASNGFNIRKHCSGGYHNLAEAYKN